MIGRVAAVLVFLGAVPAAAQDLTASPRPAPNPHFIVAAPALAPAVAAASGAGMPAGAMGASLRPRPRPGAIETRVAAARSPAAADPGLDLMGLRPAARPDDLEPEDAPIEAAAVPAAKAKKKKSERATTKGSVCGVNAIRGEKIATIRSKVKGCGLKDGVRVTSVSGVALSQSITVDCATATALNTWVDQVVQPAFRGDVVELRVAAHYICRSRNNIKGAKVSEHGRGKAVDISAFVLASGKVLTVEDSYTKTLRKVHKAACGLFTTTLGPGSDGYHEDHLHLDTAVRKGGSAYCR